MTAQIVLEDDHHQRQRSVVVAGAGRGVEHLLAQTVVVAAGFARATWPESVPVADLRFPLAIMEPEQRGDRVSESGGARRVAASCLRVPDPQFPTTTTPARQGLSGSEPLAASGGGELDSHRQAGESRAAQLRWAGCPDDGRLHLLQPADVVVATTAGHAEALCGQALPAESLTLTYALAGALCMTCIAGITPHNPQRQPDAHRPVGTRPATGQDLPTAVGPISDQPVPRWTP